MLMIVAIAWIYVVLMMSLTEHSVIAGIMTFLLYCVLPLGTILYLMDSPRRRRVRLSQVEAANKTRMAQESPNLKASESDIPPGN